jgi:ABC-type polysaccharide/polyol phosphate export permease
MASTKIYDSTKTPFYAIEEIQGLIRYKDLLFQLIRRNIVTRYKRSTLGILWTMLNPLGTMVILSIVFSRVFAIRGVYPAFIITNLIAWNFFLQTTQFSLNTTMFSSDLFNRIYLPRTSFVISMNGAGFVNLLFSLVPLALIFLVTHVSIGLPILLFPFAMILLAFFTIGFSLLVSTVVVYFPDIAELYPVLLQGWFYVTPIIYPDSVLQDFVGGWILKINPLYHVLKVFQMTLYDGLFPSIAQWMTALFISLFILILGWFVYTGNARTFQF